MVKTTEVEEVQGERMLEKTLVKEVEEVRMMESVAGNNQQRSV